MGGTLVESFTSHERSGTIDPVAMNESHATTLAAPAGTAGRSSYAGSWRTYAWRFI